ncbi:MAG: cytochrome c family protein [Alphaproteobacteria bacterium]|nr:cytochrome c family protein [Alphaproteobacteria bacterium]
MVRSTLAMLAAAALGLAVGAAPAAAQDVEAGKKAFLKCKTCHAIEAGKNQIGPTLHGIIGRKSGQVAGFKYSKAMLDWAGTWDEKTLDAYIANPKAVVPSGSMAFVGIKAEKERADLIAYLKEATK